MTTLGIMAADSPADVERGRALKKMKLFATSLLVVMAVIFVVAWTLEAKYPWVGYVRAAAEAGMVGALADWFAVTALFRRPLGLPIPHTAIIPERKAAIGSSLSEFVADNFLNEEVVRDKLSRLEIASRTGAWLSRESGSSRVTAELANAVKGIVNVLDDDDIAEIMAGMIRRRTEEIQVGPPLGRIIGDVISRGDHRDLVNVLVERLYEWVVRNEALVSGAVRNRAPSWTPKFVDSLVSDKLYREIEHFLRAVRDDEHHQIRVALDHFITDLAEDLQHDPRTIARAEEVKRRIIENPHVQTLVGSAWTSVKTVVLEAAADPDSVLRRRLTDSIQEFGRKLVQDRGLAAKIDHWITDAAGYASRRYAREVAGIIDDTVANWDGEATSRKIELLVGRDLQFIRINGTVVGALAGLIIYTLAHHFLG